MPAVGLATVGEYDKLTNESSLQNALGNNDIDLYRPPSILREPSDETEGKYLAEIVELPGYQAWGDTAAQALESLQSVAAAFIQSYRGRGDPLPPQVAAAVVDA